MTDSPSAAEHFRQAYQHQPPWEIGHLQPALAAVAEQIQGSILDAGCGTGDAALYFAARGQEVYGIDFVAEAIALARAKAAQRQLEACFLVLDVAALRQLPRQFDNVIDCGLFHVLDDADRAQYVDGLRHVLAPGGRLWLLCWSDQEPPKPGPRRIARQELQETFAAGWVVEALDDVHMEAGSHVPPGTFTEGGPRAYRMIARMVGGG